MFKWFWIWIWEEFTTSWEGFPRWNIKRCSRNHSERFIWTQDEISTSVRMEIFQGIFGKTRRKNLGGNSGRSAWSLNRNFKKGVLMALEMWAPRGGSRWFPLATREEGLFLCSPTPRSYMCVPACINNMLTHRGGLLGVLGFRDSGPMVGTNINGKSGF